MLQSNLSSRVQTRVSPRLNRILETQPRKERPPGARYVSRVILRGVGPSLNVRSFGESFVYRGQGNAPLPLGSSEADEVVAYVAASVYVGEFAAVRLLSISKEGSFECRDARIKTRDLEYRNQTWSVSNFFRLLGVG